MAKKKIKSMALPLPIWAAIEAEAERENISVNGFLSNLFGERYKLDPGKSRSQDIYRNLPPKWRKIARESFQEDFRLAKRDHPNITPLEVRKTLYELTYKPMADRDKA